MCESCQLGKYHQSSYYSHDGIPTSAHFDLFYYDIWDPAYTLSISSHRFYILLFYHYTHVSWVCLLYNCSKVVIMITHFITKVVTQYSIAPKILRTNNTLELFKTSLYTLCVDRSIIHQTTCPHSSHKNGVTE